MLRTILIGLLLIGCGGSAATQETKRPEPPRKAEAEPTRPPHTLFRDEVTDTVDQGLGYFLQRVNVEPEVRGGRFIGFRIVELVPADWWRGVDLQPGDVVLSVNGMPIERETEAFAAFEALRTADALRVTYLRGGEQKQLVYSIVDRQKQEKTSGGTKPARKKSGKTEKRDEVETKAEGSG